MPEPHPILTPDQRLRVFVSSTLQELAQERKAARRAIERLRLAPVMFELGARPHPPRDLYRAYLDQSHIFLGIYWQSYGWVAPEESVSGLEDEYNLSGDRPKLIYVKSPAHERQPRLRELLDRIKGDDQASYKAFSTPRDLARLVEDDLVLLLSERFEAVQAMEHSAPQSVHGGASLATPRAFSNVPTPAAPLIGREREVAAASELLRQEDVRLVSLSGPGGTGKTRLAVAVAEQRASDFGDGVCFIPLAPLRDPALVPSTIVRALGITEVAGQTLIETLETYLRDRHLLLVLDNFEQVVDAAPIVADLLAKCPSVKVLVTTRTVLRLMGEHDFPVPPLQLPDRRQAADTGALAQNEAVHLFVDRARAVKPDFQLTNENAPAVVEICYRLDGLPLAIELAAARVRLLPPEALLARLSNSLKLLTGGPRDVAERQQTLRGAIDWSYRLLDPDERAFFAHLGVFAGSTLNAIESICDPEGDFDVLGTVESLVEKSLLRQEEGTDGELRFVMLQTVREYAREKLEQGGRAQDVSRRHAGYYLAIAERTQAEFAGKGQVSWLDRLEEESDNLRTALEWALSGGDKGAEVALRFGSALWTYWLVRGYLSEARIWLERALSNNGRTSASRRAWALSSAGSIALFQGDYSRATTFLEEGLGLFRGLTDDEGIASVLTNLGYVAAYQQDTERAGSILSETLALKPRLRDRRVVAYLLIFHGLVAAIGGDIAGAVPPHEESLAIFREMGDEQGQVWCLTNLGLLALGSGDLARATGLLKENLELARRLRDVLPTQYSLLGLAGVASVNGHADRAARLWGAAEASREAVAFPLPPLVRERTNYNGFIDATRSALGSVAFNSAWSEGRAMTFDEAVAYALERPPSGE